MLSVGSVAGSAPAVADELSYLTPSPEWASRQRRQLRDDTAMGLRRMRGQSMWVPLDTTVNNLVWAPENSITYEQATGLAIAATHTSADRPVSTNHADWN